MLSDIWMAKKWLGDNLFVLAFETSSIEERERFIMLVVAEA